MPAVHSKRDGDVVAITNAGFGDGYEETLIVDLGRSGESVVQQREIL